MIGHLRPSEIGAIRLLPLFSFDRPARGHSARPRMRSVINRQQLIGRHMRIPLGGAEGCMSQHLLDAAEVGTLVEEMSCKRVPQRVRAHGSSREPAGILGDDAGDAATRQTPASVVAE
jgi:hypothetical protein